jgi:tRNA A-37 threonylcarbamoyl transferase component Bud32
VNRFDLQPSTLFAVDFRILRPLGEGGMGAIYAVEQISTGKHRALKLMLPQLVADAALRKRFEQEARVGALIESEHVVEVVAAGVDASTQMPWIVMELLVGDDLSQLVAQRGALGAAEVLSMFEQLCHAVGAAHRAGVVHRDLKPENIFLAHSKRASGELTVKVLDFGIAKIVADAKTSRTAPVGSPMWMAPEQTDGTKVGPPADIWSLGLIAFHLLTGRYFWSAANGEDTTVTQLLREILFEPIPPASARAEQLQSGFVLPEGFDAWFGRCVARDPAMRFQSAGDLLVSLRTVLSGHGPARALAAPIVAAAASTDPGASRVAKQRATLGALAVAGVVAAAVVAWTVRPRRLPVPTVHADVSIVPPPTLSPPPVVSLEAPAVASEDAGAPVIKSVAVAVHASTVGQKEPAPCVSEEQLEKLVHQHMTHLNRMCFERSESERPSVDVNATVAIGADGFPLSVTTTGDDPSVARCVETHVRLWHFPVVGCTQKISIPLRFRTR